MKTLLSRREIILFTVISSVVPSLGYAKSNLYRHIVGNKNAKIKVKEYLSLTCGHCANFHSDTYPLIKSNFIDTGLMSFEFIDYPIDKLAMIGATLIRSIPNESYLEGLDLLLKNQKKWVFSKDQLEELFKISKIFGFTKKRFENLLGDRSLMQKIIDKMNTDAKKFDIQSTPTFIVNDELKITGYLTFKEFKKRVNEFVKI